MLDPVGTIWGRSEGHQSSVINSHTLGLSWKSRPERATVDRIWGWTPAETKTARRTSSYNFCGAEKSSFLLGTFSDQLNAFALKKYMALYISMNMTGRKDFFLPPHSVFGFDNSQMMNSSRSSLMRVLEPTDVAVIFKCVVCAVVRLLALSCACIDDLGSPPYHLHFTITKISGSMFFCSWKQRLGALHHFRPRWNNLYCFIGFELHWYSDGVNP